MPVKKKVAKKDKTRPSLTPTTVSSSGRGKTIDRFLCIEKLKPYFQLELGFKRACAAYNTKARDEYLQALAMGRARSEKPDYIAPSTVQTWYETDEAVRSIIDSWKDTTNILARQAWRAEIKKWSYAASKDWLERREKDSFSIKTEVEQVWNVPQLPQWASIRIEKANILFQLWTQPSPNNPSSPQTSSK